MLFSGMAHTGLPKLWVMDLTPGVMHALRVVLRPPQRTALHLPCSSDLISSGCPIQSHLQAAAPCWQLYPAQGPDN